MQWCAHFKGAATPECTMDVRSPMLVCVMPLLSARALRAVPCLCTHGSGRHHTLSYLARSHALGMVLVQSQCGSVWVGSQHPHTTCHACCWPPADYIIEHLCAVYAVAGLLSAMDEALG
jgi:hypothetical protein